MTDRKIIMENVGENELNLVEHEAVDVIGDVEFKGMAIGQITRFNQSYLFAPYVEFDPDEMDGLDADSLEDLLDSVNNEVNQCYDLLESRVESGWTYYGEKAQPAEPEQKPNKLIAILPTEDWAEILEGHSVEIVEFTDEQFEAWNAGSPLLEAGFVGRRVLSLNDEGELGLGPVMVRK